MQSLFVLHVSVLCCRLFLHIHISCNNNIAAGIVNPASVATLETLNCQIRAYVIPIQLLLSVYINVIHALVVVAIFI